MPDLDLMPEQGYAAVR